MVVSLVGGIGSTFSTGVPQSWGRRHRAWILMLYSPGTRVVLLGWFSFFFGISNTLCKCLTLPTNPLGPSVSDGWSYCFYSSLLEAHVAGLLLGLPRNTGRSSEEHSVVGGL